MSDTYPTPSTPAVRWTEVFAAIEPDAFAELAILAGQVSRAPIALVTLLDENRHWFTSVIGAQLTEGPWEQTFCAHAVRQTAIFMVPDATLDHRFSGSPLVRASPHVRFYAGAPLLADGRVLGTLCVMDVKPRQLPADSAANLRALARQVVTQLQLRRQTRELAREVSERQLTEGRLRASEAALQAFTERLERASDDRRELVANISHDLRTPLTALQAYLDTLLLKGHQLDAGARRQYLGQAAAISRRLARLVADLFELAQLDCHRVQLKLEPLELADLTRDVVQSFALGARAKRIALSARDGDRPAMVAGDVRLIERVLENLLDNAIRFTPDQGKISVTCEQSGDNVVVRVVDTGPGIAAADAVHIFDRFYRGRQPVHGSSTAGLGLSIARRVIELHHGVITATRAAGGGAEFAFSLPACAPSPYVTEK